ncbi:WD40 repeat domain-containing protein [Leptolyngbya sp. AN02str]|uniref:WD40 repeat domain-containing protein n=1 Tax=Leptolyngbya sp. AN02str TaxID=3423363 RepID=UPI003D31602D
MAKLLSTHLSTQVLHFRPGQSPRTFEVTVNNHSPEFATFQVEVLASGVESGAGLGWYRQAPDLSAKIPPGDRAQFAITILDVPPVVGGFVGSMNLTVRVFSVELRQEDRQVVSLVVEGSGIMPPRLHFLDADVTATPPQSLEIGVQVSNPNRSLMTVGLTLRGLPLEWLPDGHERRVEVPPLSDILTVFLCQLGAPIESPSQSYPFEVEARVTPVVGTRGQGRLTVLPAGHLAFGLMESVVTYPPTSGTAAEPGHLQGAPVMLQFTNQGNVPQEVTPVVDRLTRLRYGPLDDGTQPLKMGDRLLLPTLPVAVPLGSTIPIPMEIAVRRPWLGWVRRHQFRIKVLRPDERVALQPASQTVMVQAVPRVRVWVQLLALALLAGTLLLLRLLPSGHRAGVNMVQFDGRAMEVLSASDDQTVRRWGISGNRLRLLKTVVRADKAVRVARYRPVDNDAIALGYENGEAEIISLRVDQPPIQLQHGPDDRVFDLQFTPDARTLFTGYGSGNVARWLLAGATQGALQPVQTQQVGFAVQALALVESDPALLAIAGRFNQIVLWDWQRNMLIPLPYPRGNNLDYITSLATVEQRPNLLAVADNQGRISLWNLQACLTGQTCRPIDDWDEGHQGQPVQAIALSDDGCYLVSGGADGQTMLWTLDEQGRRVQERSLGRSRRPIDTVDARRQGDRLHVVSGSNDHRVRLHTLTDAPPCQP